MKQNFALIILLTHGIQEYTHRLLAQRFYLISAKCDCASVSSHEQHSFKNIMFHILLLMQIFIAIF